MKLQLEELESRLAPANVNLGAELAGVVGPQNIGQGIAQLGLAVVQQAIQFNTAIIQFNIAAFQLTQAEGNPTQDQSNFLLNQLGSQVAGYYQLLGMEQLFTDILVNH